MVYVFEVNLVHKGTNIPIRTMVECVQADDSNKARTKLEEQIPVGWEIKKATLVGSRLK